MLDHLVIRRAGLVAAAIAAITLAACSSSSGGGDGAPANTDGAVQQTDPAAPATTAPATTTPPATTDGAQLGIPVAFQDGSNEGTLTVNSIRSNDGKSQLRPPTNGKYLVANVTVAGTKGSVSSTDMDFKIQLSDGEVVRAELLGTEENPLLGKDLSAGQKVTGDVAFDVAADATAVAVLMRTDLSSATTVTVRVA